MSESTVTAIFISFLVVLVFVLGYYAGMSH